LDGSRRKSHVTANEDSIFGFVQIKTRAGNGDYVRGIGVRRREPRYRQGGIAASAISSAIPTSIATSRICGGFFAGREQA
jgi:hypothetical protein